MVAKAHRGRGLATRILAQLAADNRAEGLTSVSSTERSNVGSQKAITRAGFIARHRILKFQGAARH